MSRAGFLIPLILITLLGFGLRIHDLQATPLRGDEAFSALYWADLPLSESLSRIAGIDPHPPLGFLLFRSWRHLMGGIEPEFALRFLTVIANVIGIPAIFALGWRLAGRWRIGLLAALLWALHPYEIWHSQDFRNYAIWAGLSVTALWLGLRLLNHRRSIDWWLYAAAAAGAALTFYTELFMMLALTCFAIVTIRHDRSFLRRFLLLQGTIAVLVLVSFLVQQAETVLSGSYPGNLQPFAAADYLTRLLPALLLGATIPLNTFAVAFFVASACMLSLLVIYRNSATQFRFVLIVAGMPLLLIGLVSLRVNVFHPRYILATVPAFVLLLALGSDCAAGYLQRFLNVKQSALATLLLLPWFVLALTSLHAYFNDPGLRKSPAWDELGDFLNGRVTEYDLIIQPSGDAAFGYYYNGPARDIALPVSSTQSALEIVEQLEIARKDFDSIYVATDAQPGWPNKDVVSGWLSENLQEVLRTNTAGLPVRQFMDWIPREDFGEALANFGDNVELVGFEVNSLPNDELLLWLYWKPRAETAASLKTFVHIVSVESSAAGSPPLAQNDRFPQAGRLDSSTWPVDTVYRDVRYLPTGGLVPGEYHIYLGWYEPISGTRLLTSDGKDASFLAAFQLE